MRDTERIDGIIDAIRELWKTLPNFKFWQIIVLIISGEAFYGQGDPSFVGDDRWLAIIKRITQRFS